MPCCFAYDAQDVYSTSWACGSNRKDLILHRPQCFMKFRTGKMTSLLTRTLNDLIERRFLATFPVSVSPAEVGGVTQSGPPLPLLGEASNPEF